MRNGEAKLTHDDLNRRRVPPKDDRSRPVRFYDRYVWPGVHGKWWTFDVRAERIQTAEEICSRLRLDDVDQAKDTLDHVKVIAQDAADRAGAADRRANTIAGTVAIAASFTLSGGALALDPNKLTDVDARRWFAIGLCVTTAAFVLSAFYALRALVATRRWNSDRPADLPIDNSESRGTQLGMRAAHLLEDFAGNWEIAHLKNRLVDLALRWLVLALAAIVFLAVIVASEVA